jgi:hypothetical protein
MQANEKLRLLNQQIVSFTAGLHPGCSMNCSALTAIFEGMCQMAPLLSDRAALEDPQVKIEVNSYRNNLFALQKALPVIEGLLLAEKASMHVKRSHLQMASQWLAASKETW